VCSNSAAGFVCRSWAGDRLLPKTKEKSDAIIPGFTDLLGPGDLMFCENFFQACLKSMYELSFCRLCFTGSEHAG